MELRSHSSVSCHLVAIHGTPSTSDLRALFNYILDFLSRYTSSLKVADTPPSACCLSWNFRDIFIDSLLRSEFKLLTKYNFAFIHEVYALLVTSKAIGLEKNAEEVKCTIMAREYDVGHYHNIKIGNISFESVEQFKYLGITTRNKNCIHEEIKRRLNPGNAYYHSVQNLLSSGLLSACVYSSKYTEL
jgi:hypothetical protein